MRVVRARDALSLDAYQIEEEVRPEPGEGQVRIRVRACGLGFVDALTAMGRYQVKPPLPFTPGVEVAGEVVALGPDVRGLALGTRVVPMVSTRGALAEQVLVRAAQLAVLPDAMSFEQAASLRSNSLTALYSLQNRAGLRTGETVLVFGAAGGVGGAAIQVSKLMGAHVIAAASTLKKREHALRLGADLAIDTEPADWRERLKDLAAGKMPDVVVDPVCGSLFEPAFRSLAWNGRYLVVGFAAGSIPSLAANLPLLKGAALIGVDIRQFNLNEPEAAEINRQQLRRWLSASAIEPQVGAVFAFEAFREALAHAASGASEGKTVVRL